MSRIQNLRLIIIALTWTLGAAAQDVPQGPHAGPPAIRVTAEASVTAEPDRAEVAVGVTSQAATAQAAAADNAKKVERALAELRKTFGKNAEIKTLGYSLAPEYRYPKEGGRPTITGYTASNTVEVKLAAVSDAGRAIDTALAAGANNVQRLHFTLKDPEGPRREALRKAIANARGRAEAMAAALGMKVKRVLFVSEESAPIQPPIPMMAARAEAIPATPIEPGTIEIRATVVLTVEITQ